MNTRTACTVLLALAALTAGCSSDEPAKPAPTATVTKTVDQAAARQACVDAWAETIYNRPADADDTYEDPEPAECAGLPEEDATDRYMDGLTKANRRSVDDWNAETDANG